MRKIFTFLLSLFILFNAQSQSVVTTTINFNGALGMTDIGGTAPATAWSRVTSGTSPTIATQAGAGMARFNSFNITADQIRTIATPVIDYSLSGCTYTKTVSFWIYRDNGYSSYGDSVSVYINTTASLTGATYINRVARSRSINQPNTQAANGWYQYTFNIPAGFNGASNFLLFKGTSQYGNNTFIDEVQYNSCSNLCTGTPAAGTATGPSGACQGVANNVALTSTGTTTTAGVTFQWESSPNGTTGWTAIGGQTTASSAVATQTAITYYRLVSTCTNGGATNISNVVTVPMTTLGCAATDGPCNASGLVVNTLGNDCAVSTTGIIDFATITPSTAPVACSGASATNGTTRDFWHTVTVPASGSVQIVSNNANTGFWDMAIYTVSTPCGSPTYTEIASECVATVQPSITLTGRTPGEVLYIRMWRDQGSALTTGTRTYTLCANTPAAAPPACLIAADYIAPLNAATNVTYQPNVTFTWNNVATATSYDIYLDLGTSPTIATTLFASNFAAQVGATTTGVWGAAAGGTSYVWYVVPRNAAGAAVGCGLSNSFTTAAAPPPPANDNCSGATSLSIGSGICGTAVSGTTLAATASGTTPAPTCGVGSSGFDDDVWYSFTPTAGQTTMNIDFVSVSGNADFVAQIYTSSDNTCTGTFTTVACSDDEGPGSMPQFTGLAVTPGTTYFVRVFTYGTAVNGQFTICAFTPPPPPPCVTNTTPANAATGVTSVATGVPLTWSTSPGATSYNVFFGTTNPPTTNIGSTAGTTINVTGTNYNTTYFWYIQPVGTGGAAIGCNTSTTSFTTEAAPNNCVPIYTTGCSGGDIISLFRLKGESTELNINTGAACSANSYVDSTDHPVIIDLARGKSYWGQAQCGFGSNYITAWIDFNDNGQFENNERLMNNLLVGTTLTNINFFIPLTAPAGNHRLRIRDVYYASAPTLPTEACSAYTFGETEDYTVNITTGGTPYTVSTYTPTGNCYTGTGLITVDAASNNNSNYVPLVDSSNAIVAQLYPLNNNLGTVSFSYYKHNGPVRQDVTGRYYLDRNFTISTSVGPVSPYNLRLCYLNAELNALIAQPGSGVTNQFDLNMTKTTGTECVTAYAQQSPEILFPTGYGILGGDRLIDFTNLTGFSRFFLHGGNTFLLPVTLSNIRGEVTGATNTVYWTTATEVNNRKFVVERSTNGSNFTAIGDVATRAINGNSSTALQYSFVDANPIQGKAFYRLQMVDNGGRTTYSPIVTLRRGAGKLEIVDVRPNPTTGNLYFNLLGVNNNSQFTLTLRTVDGKAILVKNNFTPLGAGVIDMSKLANGMYILEAVDVRNGEKAVFKVMKQ